MTSPLIFIHGVGLDKTMWAPLRAQIRGIETYAYDLRGHGEAALWDGSASLDQFVDDLWEFADHHGLKTFALCGFSLGVLISQWAALQKPERIEELILICGVYKRRPEQYAGVRERLKLAEKDGPQAIIDAALERWFPASFAQANPDLLVQTRQRLEGNNHEQFLKSYRLFAYSGAEIDGRLPEIQQPTFVTTGGRDTGSTVEMTDLMADEIPNASSMIYEDAAHMLPMQETVALGKTIEMFLRSGYVD